MTSPAPDALLAYRDALYEALASSAPGVADAAPLQLLDRIARRGAALAGEQDEALQTVAALDAVAHAGSLEAAIAAAALRFETPARLAEAIYFARCLGRDAEGALASLRQRRYVDDATVGADQPELATDRATLLPATSFTALWTQPERLQDMLDTLSAWRRAYIAAYSQRHASFQAAIAVISETVDALLPAAAAIERLNALSQLGAPLAAGALARLHELERLFPCELSGAELAEALQATPLCPRCAFRLGDVAPVAEARRLRGALERGLAGQQSRLARRVVARLLQQPAGSNDDRLQRFIQVVQASDLSGLVLVLDESLVDFLRGLLDATMPPPGVLQRLAAAYPEVTAGEVEAAVAELRRLLWEELARGGSARLASATELP